MSEPTVLHYRGYDVDRGAILHDSGEGRRSVDLAGTAGFVHQRSVVFLGCIFLPASRRFQCLDASFWVPAALILICRRHVRGCGEPTAEVSVP